MTLLLAAKRLHELGHQRRLEIFKLLVVYGHHGLETGKISEQLSIPSSTLSHHIKRLVQVGLIEQQQYKQTIICKPNFTALNQTIAFLKVNCCEKHSGGTNS